LTNVDKPVTIDAPSSGRPIQELFGGASGGNDETQINTPTPPTACASTR
jgi:hypothetical protein